MPASHGLSPELLAANARLAALREQHQAQKQTDLLSVAEKAAPPNDPVVSGVVADLPAHLGWGSAALTAVLRRQRRETSSVDAPAADSQSCMDRLHRTAILPPTADTPSNSPDIPFPQASNGQAAGWVKLYPDIGLGMLRQELTAPGRLWLMLRYLDGAGQGSLRIGTVQTLLTQKTSAYRLCGKRQLRNLLQDGEGVYWTRDRTHLWLRSAARVAAALDVERLTGLPVALPVAALLEGIGAFRAHLYAAFHSGRLKETPDGRRVMPIARETLSQLSGVGRSSQRAYEEQAGVVVQANFAVGELSTKENLEKRAWANGQALFELKDYRGQQGKKGKTYLAWQLPNSYTGQHRPRPRGRQKRINRELKDLVMQGMPGNGEGTSETQKPEKVYFPNGKLAAKAYGRDPERDLYWKRHRTENGRFSVWQQLGG